MDSFVYSSDSEDESDYNSEPTVTHKLVKSIDSSPEARKALNILVNRTGLRAELLRNVIYLAKVNLNFKTKYAYKLALDRGTYNLSHGKSIILGNSMTLYFLTDLDVTSNRVEINPFVYDVVGNLSIIKTLEEIIRAYTDYRYSNIYFTNRTTSEQELVNLLNQNIVK